MDNPGLQNIKKMYEKINYFDQYGGSVILFIIITIILFLMISYCFVMINAQPIIDDWPNQRCKPSVIPFAGLITHPEGVSASDYTSQNFTYCTQNILSSITGTAVEPLTFITNMLQSVADSIKQSIQAIREMFNKIRTSMQEVSQEIMGRIMNIMIPLQQIITGMRDMISKVQGSMTAGLFTLLGSYYTLKSLMGAILQFIIIILIALAVMVAILWIIPFTWGAAIANTAIFIAIAIPLAIIMAFMIDVLKVKTSLSIPSIKCFDKNTSIKMNDGSEKIISEIKPGDILSDNNEVTAVIKVETKGSEMYYLDDISVSDSHIVNYKGKWIPVSKHPDSLKYAEYNEPYLYCLNTSNKTIKIDDILFTDWDEIYDKDISEIILNPYVKINNTYEIHKELDSGFGSSTIIKLVNGDYKEIKDIVVGDILANGEKVYGVVEINGENLSDQFKFILGENSIVEGGPNLMICDSKISNISTLAFGENLTCDYNYLKIKLEKKHNKLYHLLTYTKTFYVENIRFYDYNAAIDILLDKNKEKLLSMKYV
jgi:hypothetical protein